MHSLRGGALSARLFRPLIWEINCQQSLRDDALHTVMLSPAYSAFRTVESVLQPAHALTSSPMADAWCSAWMKGPRASHAVFLTSLLRCEEVRVEGGVGRIKSWVGRRGGRDEPVTPSYEGGKDISPSPRLRLCTVSTLLHR